MQRDAGAAVWRAGCGGLAVVCADGETFPSVAGMSRQRAGNQQSSGIRRLTEWKSVPLLFSMPKVCIPTY